MAPKGKSVTVVLSDPQEKKTVTRFDNDTDGAALKSVYVDHAALKTLGNPSKVKITIEAA